MRVDNVNQNKGIGYIKFNSDTEMDLIAESLDKLVKKQEKLFEKTGDAAESKKLDRFKQSKNVIIEIPKQNRIRLQSVRQNVKDKFDKDYPNKKNNNEKNRELDVEDTEEFKNMSKVMQDAEEGSGLVEGTEVTHRNIHVLVNALNEHIWELEKNDGYKLTRRMQNKYEKLKQILQNAQEQKAQFERVRPKPKGFGRLRK